MVVAFVDVLVDVVLGEVDVVFITLAEGEVGKAIFGDVATAISFSITDADSTAKTLFLASIS